MSMSKVDKIPTGESNMEANLLTRVPEEMWLKIFNLVEQKDLRYISMSSPIFSEYLHKKKVKFLFLHAVPILTSYLDLKDILKCREVCKAWETAVNSCFENATRPLCEEDIKKNQSMIEDLQLFWYPLSKFNSRIMEKMEKVTVGHPRNPIVGRHFDVTTPEEIAIGDDFEYIDAMLYAPVERCLQQFGVHIWHLNVYDKGESLMSLLEYFSQLRKFLLLCPNLKSFGFTVSCIYELNNEGQFQLTNFINTNALPAMHSLQRIKTGTNENLIGLRNNRFVQTGMARIQDILMARYATQLQSLDLHWLQWKPSYCNEDALQNLRELRLREIYSNESLAVLTQRMSTTMAAGVKLPSLMGLDLGLKFEFNEIDVKGALIQLVRTVKQASDLRRVGLAISFSYTNGPDSDDDDWDYTGAGSERYFSEDKYFLLERKDENLEKLEENFTNWIEDLELEESEDGDCYNSDDDDAYYWLNSD